MTPRIITIDGPSGAGKSTAARALAAFLGYYHLDTGATYRALACAAIGQGLDPERDSAQLAALARSLPLAISAEPGAPMRVELAGRDVTAEIRTEAVGEAASSVSQHPEVRAALVALQRRLAEGRDVVAEGRDTGSVVFPNAQHKFFLDADESVRAQRRSAEMSRRFGVAVTVDAMAERMRRRDRRDATRASSPLVRPEGAVVIDTRAMTPEQVVSAMLERVRSGGNPAQRDGADG